MLLVYTYLQKQSFVHFSWFQVVQNSLVQIFLSHLNSAGIEECREQTFGFGSQQAQEQ